MFIAIDDTYGPDSVTESKYVTGLRRTNVAVIFEDSQADFVREQLLGCLDAATDIVGCEVGEFHFVDIFNRKPPWDREENINLKVFEFF